MGRRKLLRAVKPPTRPPTHEEDDEESGLFYEIEDQEEAPEAPSPEVEDDDDDEDNLSEFPLPPSKQDKMIKAAQMYRDRNGPEALARMIDEWADVVAAEPAFRFQIYRDEPADDEDGIPCKGMVAEVKVPVSPAYIERHLGGGKYHVTLYGPKRTKNGVKRGVMHSVNGIDIPGSPLQNTKFDRKYQTAAAKEIIEKREHERALREAELARAKEEQERLQKQDPFTAALLQNQQELQRRVFEMSERRGGGDEGLASVLEQMREGFEAMRENSSRPDNSQLMMLEVLKSMVSKPETPKDHSEVERLNNIILDLQKSVDRSETRRLEEINALRAEHNNERIQWMQEKNEALSVERAAKTEAVDRERRDATERLELVRTGLQDRMDQQRENYETRVQMLQSQLDEAKTKREEFWRQVDAAKEETSKVRHDSLKELMTVQAAASDMGNLTKQAQTITQLAGLFGLQRADAVAATPTVSIGERIADGFVSVVTNPKIGELAGAVAARMAPAPVQNPAPPATSQPLYTQVWQQSQADLEAQRQVQPQVQPDALPATEAPPAEPIDEAPPEVRRMSPQEFVQHVEQAAMNNDDPKDTAMLLMASNGVTPEEARAFLPGLSIDTLIEMMGLDPDLDVSLMGKEYMGRAVKEILDGPK